MNKGKLIRTTDLILVPVFILSLYTGVKLHLASHHGVISAHIQQWTVAHVLVTLLFLILILLHVWSHWGWYRALKNGCKGKKKVVLLLSLLFLIVALTGIYLFFIHTSQNHVGLLHYRFGIALGILAFLHILKRRKFLFQCQRHRGHGRA